jgi:acetyltransferase-like isoleucine patch superfamily enzyme
MGLNHKCILATRTEGAFIEIGHNSGMSGVSLVAFKEIKIGNNVLIGANSSIIDGDGHFELGKTEPKSVLINDNVWIGANCTILKGVEIGKNSIIGANSLVITSIPENVVALGNPCRVISKISQQ